MQSQPGLEHTTVQNMASLAKGELQKQYVESVVRTVPLIFLSTPLGSVRCASVHVGACVPRRERASQKTTSGD